MRAVCRAFGLRTDVRAANIGGRIVHRQERNTGLGKHPSFNLNTGLQLLVTDPRAAWDIENWRRCWVDMFHASKGPIIVALEVLRNVLAIHQNGPLLAVN